MCCHSWNPGTFCRQPRHVVTGEFWPKIIFSGERNAKRRVRLSKKMDVMVKELLSQKVQFIYIISLKFYKGNSGNF